MTWAMLALALALLCSCTTISGPCTREVTVRTECEPGGTAVVFPPSP
jgi:hypothetical protein